MFDGEAFGAQVVEAVKAYVDEVTAPLIARIAELEQRPTSEAVEERVQQAVRSAVEALPRPPEVKSVERADVEAMVGAIVSRAVSEAVAELPPPRDGKDADPQVIRSMVADAIAALPKPQDGKDADPAQVQRMVDEAVARLPPPKDGVGVAGAVIDRAGNLILTLSNGETRDLGRVEGKNGDPGFSLTDFEVEQIDLRTLVLSFVAGEVRHSYEVSLGGFIDRGVFKDGETYELGDAVTWGGSLWIAQCETTAKPETNGDWRLAVKRGRDGKDFGK